ncbi:GL25463 [Drosophila persimilis]|uniref:GL25463 n=1 Tax=Drosophila persimilis TaxID=7234 RepID=B4HDF1_DROPE|nr:GL25463 [Drosophila persimilis]
MGTAALISGFKCAKNSVPSSVAWGDRKPTLRCDVYRPLLVVYGFIRLCGVCCPAEADTVLDSGISEVQKDDGVDKSKFDEDFVHFYECAVLGPIQQRFCSTVPDKVPEDYEQMFETIGKVTKEMVDFRKYELYVMLYPTLAIAYLQMVWSGKLKRHIYFVRRNKHELYDSYKRRIEMSFSDPQATGRIK